MNVEIFIPRDASPDEIREAYISGDQVRISKLDFENISAYGNIITRVMPKSYRHYDASIWVEALPSSDDSEYYSEDGLRVVMRDKPYDNLIELRSIVVDKDEVDESQVVLALFLFPSYYNQPELPDAWKDSTLLWSSAPDIVVISDSS